MSDSFILSEVLSLCEPKQRYSGDDDCLSIVIVDETSQTQASPAVSVRSGFDESKCRNVLVRHCAHIPRNYQYRDGIQQVFLILREHLGDETLDLAGGVLYEFIEVDCEYSDDPGAAFQRWRRDHMNRHADFELPHIPHMTTITSAIRPTARLVRWREKHPERYQIRLSDHSASTIGDALDHGCIRTRKTWIIEHTTYVSSRDGGTRPFCTPSPKEFHEMQWNTGYGRGGRLVGEKEVTVAPTALRSQLDGTTGAYEGLRRRDLKKTKPLLSRRSWNSLIKRISCQKITGTASESRRSWFSNILGLDTVMSLREFLESRPVPLPEGCPVPNAIFARKFGLVDDDRPLPPSLSLKPMPTAESKATDAVAEAAARGDVSTSWRFRGPFTPQLGFDGGLDYRWEVSDPFSLTASQSPLSPAPRLDVLSPVSYSPRTGLHAPSVRLATPQTRRRVKH